MEGELFGMILFGIGGLIWLLIPFLDRDTKEKKQSKLVVGFGIFVVMFIIGMTLYGYLVE